jgi:hypothetical protein
LDSRHLRPGDQTAAFKGRIHGSVIMIERTMIMGANWDGGDAFGAAD